MPTLNHRFSSGPQTTYFGNVIQTIPQGLIIRNNSVNIYPDALQSPTGAVTTAFPNDKLSDNSSQYNARYNIVLNYTGTREILLNWYLYKANLQLPLARKLIYHVCLIDRLVYSLDYTPLYDVSPIPSSTITNQINATTAITFNNSLISGTGIGWRVATFTIPDGIYTRSSLNALLASQIGTLSGTTAQVARSLSPFTVQTVPLPALALTVQEPLSFPGFSRPANILSFDANLFLTASNSIYNGMAIGLFFGSSPNASTFMGCANPDAGFDPHGNGIYENRAILITRGLPNSVGAPTVTIGGYPNSRDQKEESRFPVMI
jgi:hypothetical protein